MAFYNAFKLFFTTSRTEHYSAYKRKVSLVLDIARIVSRLRSRLYSDLKSAVIFFAAQYVPYIKSTFLDSLFFWDRVKTFYLRITIIPVTLLGNTPSSRLKFRNSSEPCSGQAFLPFKGPEVGI